MFAVQSIPSLVLSCFLSPFCPVSYQVLILMAPLLTRKAGRLKAFYISNKTDKHKYYYGHTILSILQSMKEEEYYTEEEAE